MVSPPQRARLATSSSASASRKLVETRVVTINVRAPAKRSWALELSGGALPTLAAHVLKHERRALPRELPHEFHICGMRVVAIRLAAVVSGSGIDKCRKTDDF